MSRRRTYVSLAVLLALVGAMLGFGISTPAGALTSYTVTSTTDGAAGSLRDVLDQANADGDDSEIDLPEGATLDLDVCGAPVVDEDSNATGDLDYTEGYGLTINGNGTTIRQTCDAQRVLHAVTDSDVQIWETTITGGDPSVGTRNGGGISMTGGGDLMLALSTVTGNIAGNVGGGVFAGDSTQVFVVDSTISGNTATGSSGGGIFALRSSLVVNSTISGNTAGRDGGGIAGDTELLYATIYGNGSVADGGSGSQIALATLTSFGSVIAEGFGQPENCGFVTTSSSGWNAEDGSSCGFSDPTDQNGIDPQLGPLADNGGPTLTHLPSSTSPLLDTIPSGSCDLTYVADQRNVSRPQGSGCDTGSVEVEVQVTTTTTTTTTTTPAAVPAQPTQATPAFTG